MFIIEITKKSGKTCINISLQLVTAMPLSVGHQVGTEENAECRVILVMLLHTVNIV